VKRELTAAPPAMSRSILPIRRCSCLARESSGIVRLTILEGPYGVNDQ